MITLRGTDFGIKPSAPKLSALTTLSWSCLHELSLRLSAVGDHAGALAAIDEAIRIRRQLAKFSPARYHARLEQSLQRQAQIEAASRGDVSMMVNAQTPGRQAGASAAHNSPKAPVD